jgi:hypothetical protein
MASFVAFLVKEKYPILSGSKSCCKFSSTYFKSVVVLPVPGGPIIL